MNARPGHFAPLAFVALFFFACDDDLARADEMLATGDFEGAAAIFEARLAKKPTDGAGTIGLARTLYMQGIEQSRTGADTADGWKLVVETMEKAVVIDPAPEGVQPVTQDMLADSLYRMGVKLYDAGDWAGAAEALDSAQDKGKKTGDLYVLLARAEHESGRTEEALKAANKALDIDKHNVPLMLEAAGWALDEKLYWVHHTFFARAQKEKGSGFTFKAPAEITGALEQKYQALNMVNDVLGTFLFEQEVGSREWDGLLEREALISDMEKFIGKKPPKDFAAADRARLHWVVYHYWNATGVVFLYMGDSERARAWLGKAQEVARSGKVAHPDVPAVELEKEIGWATKNLALIP